MKISVSDVFNDRYEIRSWLADGGMSVVYRAHDRRTGEPVAVKVLKPETTAVQIENIVRFRREIDMISRLSHACIVPVYDSGEFEGVPYIVMKLIEGTSLCELLRRGRTFTIEESLSIITGIAEALEYVHTKGILHRDLKPANIMIGNDLSVTLLDFGLAHVLNFTALKGEQEIVGTFGFMSPEATGIVRKPVDERSDLYSLGIVMYRLLAGELPFTAREVGKLLHEQISSEPPPLCKCVPGIPCVIESIVQRLLYKEPDQRYQSARGLLHDLRRFVKGEQDFVIGERDPKLKLNFQTRLIGRDDEVAYLRSRYHEAAKNNGSICLIHGEPGVGKSKLVGTLKTYAYEQGGVFFAGRCQEQKSKIPYQVFKDTLNEYILHVSRLSDADAERWRQCFRKQVGEFGELVSRVNPRIMQLLDTVPQIVPLDPDREARRFFMIMTQILLGMTPRDTVCVLYIEDLQWIDTASLGLLAEMMEKLAESNVCIVAGYYSDSIETDSVPQTVKDAARRCMVPLRDIELAPLDTARMGRMLAEILGVRPDSIVELTAFVLEKSGGNPFFAVNVIRELVEKRVIRWENGKWHEDWREIRSVTFPERMVDIIVKRVADLPADERKVLSRAALIGREFHIDLLAVVSDVDKETLVTVLDNAMRRQLLDQAPGAGIFVFAHERIREALRSYMAREEAMAIHRRIGDAIQELGIYDEQTKLFALAHHYTEAGDDENTLLYTVPAAERSWHESATEEAVRYATAALVILEKWGYHGSDAWLRAKHCVIGSSLTRGEFSLANIHAREMLSHLTDPRRKAQVNVFLGSAYYRQGYFSDAERLFLDALELLGYRKPRRYREVAVDILKQGAYALFVLPVVRLLRGRREPVPTERDEIELELWHYLVWLYAFSKGYRFPWPMLHLYNLSVRRFPRAQSMLVGYFGLACFFGAFSMYSPAKRILKKVIAVARDDKRRFSLSVSANYMGLYSILSWQGKYDESMEVIEKARRILEKEGDLWYQGLALHLSGHNHYYRAQYAHAYDCFRKYLEVSEKLHDMQGIAASSVYLAMVSREMGDQRRSEKHARHAHSLSKAQELWFTFSAACMQQGIMALEDGDLDKAVQLLEEARSCNRKHFFMRDYIAPVYLYLMEAYLLKYAAASDAGQRRELLRKLKKSRLSARLFTAGLPNHRSHLLRTEARYRAAIGRRHGVDTLFQKSIAAARRLGRIHEEAQSRCALGSFLESIGETASARQNMESAYELFRRIGARTKARKLAAQLGVEDSAGRSEGTTTTGIDILQSERRMLTLLETSRDLSAILDLDVLIERILDATMELTGAERGVLLLYPDSVGNSDSRRMQVAAARNVKESDTETGTSECLCGVVELVAREKKPLVFDSSAGGDLVHECKRIVEHDLKSVLCVPVMAGGALIGALYFDSRLVSGLFSEADMRIIGVIAAQAGVSIQNARLYRQAVTDGLTTMYNRTFFDNYLMHKVEEFNRYGGRLALMMIDVDHFKTVNDTWGHQAGDALLTEVAAIFRNQMRSSDVVVRYGGDEFAVIMPEVDDGAERIAAERLRQAVEQRVFSYEIDGRTFELSVTLSIGVARIQQGQGRVAFIEAADKALYDSKQNGRNRVTVFSSDQTV